QRDVRRTGGPAIEPRELLVRHLAEPPDAVGLHRRHVAPAARADDPQLTAVQVGATEALDEARQVLPRLQRPNGEHVVAVRSGALRRKGLADGYRDDADLPLVDAEELDELPGGERRDRDQ